MREWYPSFPEVVHLAGFLYDLRRCDVETSGSVDLDRKLVENGFERKGRLNGRAGFLSSA